MITAKSEQFVNSFPPNSVDQGQVVRTSDWRRLEAPPVRVVGTVQQRRSTKNRQKIANSLPIPSVLVKPATEFALGNLVVDLACRMRVVIKHQRYQSIQFMLQQDNRRQH